jgi:hypothetical protein
MAELVLDTTTKSNMIAKGTLLDKPKDPFLGQRKSRKGIQNNLTKQYRKIVTYILNCVTEQDMLQLYTWMMKDKKNFLFFLKVIAPKKFNVDINERINLDTADRTTLYNIALQADNADNTSK